MGWIVTAHGRIHYREWGAPSAKCSILAFHGFGQTSAFFGPLASALIDREDVHLVAPDLRGHGQSDDFSRGPADDVFVEDATAVWSGAVNRPAIWFGSSLGARIAAFACAKNPAMAAQLVLGECMVGFQRRWSMLLSRARQLLENRPLAFSSTAEAKGYGARVRHLGGLALDLWSSSAIEANRDGTCRERLSPRFLAPSYWPEHEEQRARALGAIECPVTLLYGAMSTAVAPEIRPQIMGCFRHASVTVLEDVGHDLFLDAPDRVADLILKRGVEHDDVG